MTLAFPNLSVGAKRRLLAYGIDAEQSLRLFLAEIFDGDMAHAEEVIEAAARMPPIPYVSADDPKQVWQRDHGLRRVA